MRKSGKERAFLLIQIDPPQLAGSYTTPDDAGLDLAVSDRVHLVEVLRATVNPGIGLR